MTDFNKWCAELLRNETNPEVRKVILEQWEKRNRERAKSDRIEDIVLRVVMVLLVSMIGVSILALFAGLFAWVTR